MNPSLCDELARDFELTAPPSLIAGGEGRTYRAGNLVVRKEHDPSEAKYIAEVVATIKEDGFRVPRPVRTRRGDWLSESGWSGWTFVEGSPATSRDVSQVITAVNRFHDSVSHRPKHAHLLARSTPFDRADRGAWEALPSSVDLRLAPRLEALLRYYRPIAPPPSQLVHGDLNAFNILVHSELPPAIIDFTPYWRPPEFALAVFAYWIGPYRGNCEPLAHFREIPQFDQLLLRAAIRTVLVTNEFVKLGHEVGDLAAEFDAAIGAIARWMSDRAPSPLQR